MMDNNFELHRVEINNRWFNIYIFLNLFVICQLYPKFSLFRGDMVQD